MPDATAKSVFWTGFRDGSPFIVVVAPFGLLFGVVSIDSGLNFIETLAMTFLVVAGASQFTALSLLKEQAPTFIVILTALAVNLRMAMYSAALAPHLGKAPLGMRALMAYFMVDQTFAVAVKRNGEPQVGFPGVGLAGATLTLPAGAGSTVVTISSAERAIRSPGSALSPTR